MEHRNIICTTCRMVNLHIAIIVYKDGRKSYFLCENGTFSWIK
jgi:hypothetical protein